MTRFLMKLIRSSDLRSWVMLAALLVIAFNNCGKQFKIKDGNDHKIVDDSNKKTTCEQDRLLTFEKTYHRFLRQNCFYCHITGGIGNGNFADENVNTAFTAFSARGYEKISSQAVNEKHMPPYTGSKNQTQIDEIKPQWIQAEEDFIQCLIDDGRPPQISEAAKTTSKNVPADLAEVYKTMSWDLETESSTKAPLLLTIDIRQAKVGGLLRGYEFRNPTIKLKPGIKAEYALRALALYFNEELKSDVTTYINIEQKVSSDQPLALAPNSGSALLVTNELKSTDQVALEFQSLKLVPAPSPSPSPTATASPTPGGGGGSGTASYAALMVDNGAFKVSCIGCHSATNPLGGLNLTVYQDAKAAATKIKTRVNSASNPMPPSGNLQEALRSQINQWVDSGAGP